MQQRPNLGVLRNTAVLVLALVAVAGCSGANQYSEQVRTNFIRSCLDSGGTATSCECSLTYIEAHKTEAEYVRIEAELLYEGVVDDVIYDALVSCVPQAAASGEYAPAPTLDLTREAASIGDFARVQGDATYVSLHVPQSALMPEDLAGLDAARANQVLFSEFLDRVGVPAGTFNRMLNTSALSGMQEISGNGLLTSWTFHPDAGLNVVISQTDAVQTARAPASAKPTSLATTTTVPDAVASVLAARGWVDDAAIRETARNLGEIAEQAVAKLLPSNLIDCIITPTFVSDSAFDAVNTYATNELTRDEFRELFFASAEIYGRYGWENLVLACG